MKKFSIPEVALLLDTEGCISIYTNAAAIQANLKPRIILNVSVTNTSKPMLLLLRRQYGGGLDPTSGPKYNRNAKECWRWVLVEGAAARLLKRVYPFLRLKKRQAALGLALAKLKEHHRTHKTGKPLGSPLTQAEYAARLFLAKRCRILNKRGRNS